MPTSPPSHNPGTRVKQHTQPRAKTAERGYGGKWQAARKRFLFANPLCVHCQEQGRITPANEVDHIIPHRGNSKLMWDQSNWQALCKSCHSRKTAGEQGTGGYVVKKTGCAF